MRTAMPTPSEAVGRINPRPERPDAAEANLVDLARMLGTQRRGHGREAIQQPATGWQKEPNGLGRRLLATGATRLGQKARTEGFKKNRKRV